MNSSWQLPVQQASLFGKLPTVLDYVRINHSYPPAIALDEWMSRALQDLTVASLSWPAARYRFLFAPTGSEHGVVGVFGPSRDRAGRKFPLSVFAPVPVAAVARKFAALPLAYHEFFAAADALLDDAPKLSRDDAAERLLSLPRLGPDALEDQHAGLQTALDERSAATFAREVYGDAEHQADEAFARAVSALGKIRSAPPERPLALDCPASGTDDVCAWLSLAEVCVGWVRDVPSLFWTTAAEPGRLLISFGTPLPALPVWLSDRKRKSDRLVSLQPTALPAYAAAPGYEATPDSSASGAAYTPSASGSAYAAPASGSAYAAPASGAAYAAPASGSAYAAPASGSAYAAPAPITSQPTPVRAPIPRPGTATPPQGFSIALPAPAPAEAPVIATEPRQWSGDTGDTGALARAPSEPSGYDAAPAFSRAESTPALGRASEEVTHAPEAEVEARGSAREQGNDAAQGSAADAGHSDVEARGSAREQNAHVATPSAAAPPRGPLPSQARGPSLWRKLRMLAIAE